MPHREGSFDTLKEANAKKRELKARGYASRTVVIKYGRGVKPLYVVWRADEKGQAYPPIKRRR